MTEPGAGSDLANIPNNDKKSWKRLYHQRGKNFYYKWLLSEILIVVACKTDQKIEPAHKGISLLVN